MSENGLEAISRLRRGHQDQLHADLHGQPGAPRGEGQGASLLSPFVGRLDDINEEGMTVIRELSEIVDYYELDVGGAGGLDPPPAPRDRVGARGRHIATLPFKVFQQMVHHPLTDKGIVQFRKDWDKARRAANHGSTARRTSPVMVSPRPDGLPIRAR